MSKPRDVNQGKCESNNREMELEEYEDLDRGWAWLVLAASFGTYIVIGGTNCSVGLFHTTLQERFGASQSKTALAASIHSALGNLGGPLSGFVADRFSVRTAVFLGASFMTLGYFLTAFAPTLEVSIITFGVIAGIGQALTWTAGVVSTGFYFRKYRNLAMGISSTGAGLGIFGIAPAVQVGKEYFGASRSFIVLCYFTLQVVVCAVIMKPSTLERQTQLKKREALSEKKRGNRQVWAYIKLLSNKSILFMSLSMFSHCIGMYIVFQYLPNYCIQEGTVSIRMSFVIAVIGIASIFGRLVTGFVANCRGISAVFVYAFTTGFTGVCSLTFPWYADTYAGQIVFAISFGLVFGGVFVTITPVNIEFVGVSNMTMALGIEIFFGGVSTISAPVLAGHILDNGGTYQDIFVLAGIANVLGAGLAILAFVMGRCGHDGESNHEQVVEAGRVGEVEVQLMSDVPV